MHIAIYAGSHYRSEQLYTAPLLDKYPFICYNPVNMGDSKNNNIRTKISTSFAGREHIREEIPVRALLREISEIRDVLQAGTETRFDVDTFENQVRPIGEMRMKHLTLLWAIDKELLHLVLPSLKPVGVTIKMPTLTKEDMEPHNIRPKMMEHLKDGVITPELAKTVCEVAGAKEGTEEEDLVPTAFEVNLNVVEGRVTRDEHGIIIESTVDDEDSLDMGDAFVTPPTTPEK